MAEAGIRRPVEFEDLFKRIKDEFHLAERYTEIVVISAFAGFYFERTGEGPFRNPVGWEYFSEDEKNRLYMLAVAITKREKGTADPSILGLSRRKDFFTLLERYVHGGLLEMRDRSVFSIPTPEGIGNNLTTFVYQELKEPVDAKQLQIDDLLRDLRNLTEPLRP